MTVREWESSPACQAMYSIDPTIWIPSHAMSEQEKKDYPTHETTEGYLKTIPLKEAWQNAWGNWTDETKALFPAIENFNADKFFEITGIRI